MALFTTSFAFHSSVMLPQLIWILWFIICFPSSLFWPPRSSSHKWGIQGWRWIFWPQLRPIVWLDEVGVGFEECRFPTNEDHSINCHALQYITYNIKYRKHEQQSGILPITVIYIFFRSSSCLPHTCNSM